MPHYSPVSRLPVHLPTTSKMKTVTAEREHNGTWHRDVRPKTLKLSSGASAQPTHAGKRAPAKVKGLPNRKKSRPSRKSGSRVSSRRRQTHKAAKVHHHESTMTASVSEFGGAKKKKTCIVAPPKCGKRTAYLHDFTPSRDQTGAHFQPAPNSTTRQLGFARMIQSPLHLNSRPLSPDLASGEKRCPPLCHGSPYVMWGKDTRAQADGVPGDFYSKTMPADPPLPLPVELSQKLVTRAWEQQPWPACWHGGCTPQGYFSHHVAPSPGETVRCEYRNPAGPADFNQLPLPGAATVPRVKKPVGILRHYVSRVNDGCSTWDSSSYQAFKRNDHTSTTESTGSTVMSTEVPDLKTAKRASFTLGIAAVALLSIWALYPLGGVAMRAWAFNRANNRREPVTVQAQKDRDPGFVPEMSGYQYGPLLPTQNAHRVTVMLVQNECDNKTANDTGTY